MSKGWIALCCVLVITNLAALSAWQSERDLRRNADEHLQEIPVAPRVIAVSLANGNWTATFVCPVTDGHVIVDQNGNELSEVGTDNGVDSGFVNWINEYANLKCVPKKEKP
jgi:hypothetical protein